MNWFTRLEQALTPDFDGRYNGSDLTRAFTLLTRLLIAFVLCMALWSFAAGTLDAGHLVGNDTIHPSVFADAWNRYMPMWLMTVIGAVLLAIKLFGAIALMAIAAGLVGGFLGFLFGLPSPSGQHATPSGEPASGDAGTTSRWIPSTNLIQITDWLTKTIVGVSLVEAKSAYTHFSALCETASLHLLNNAFGSGVVVPSVLISTGILGFKYGNLYTLLFLARLIAEAGNTLSSLTREQKAAAGTIAQIDSDDAAIAEPIAKTAAAAAFTGPSVEATTATPEQRTAAIEFGRKSLASLSTYDTVLAWARSRALLNDYPGAADGYRKLIPLMQPRNPAILAEAARVFAKTGGYVEAKAALTDALALQAPAAPQLRVPIVRDYVVLALYEPKPQGYTDALSRLDDAVVNADNTGELALLRACAAGQKYATETTLPADERQQIHDRAMADLKTALNAGQSKAWITYLSDAKAPGKPPPGSPEREDDLEIFHDDPAFRALMDAPAPGDA